MRPASHRSLFRCVFQQIVRVEVLGVFGGQAGAHVSLDLLAHRCFDEEAQGFTPFVEVGVKVVGAQAFARHQVALEEGLQALGEIWALRSMTGR